jgi:hypothetical protein
MVYWVEDRSPKGSIIVSVFGTVIFTGSAAEYPVGLAAWVVSPMTCHLQPDYHFTPLHRSAHQDALVLAYRKYLRTKCEPRLPEH